jgi:hypothetical protein
MRVIKQLTQRKEAAQHIANTVLYTVVFNLNIENLYSSVPAMLSDLYNKISKQP